MKQRLEVNAEYLSRSQSYDQHYENYTRCLQEIQLKKQALDAFDEAVIVFDEQCRLHEKSQREAQRHEMMDGRLMENYDFLKSLMAALQHSRIELHANL